MSLPSQSVIEFDFDLFKVFSYLTRMVDCCTTHDLCFIIKSMDLVINHSVIMNDILILNKISNTANETLLMIQKCLLYKKGDYSMAIKNNRRGNINIDTCITNTSEIISIIAEYKYLIDKLTEDDMNKLLSVNLLRAVNIHTRILADVDTQYLIQSFNSGLNKLNELKPFKDSDKYEMKSLNQSIDKIHNNTYIWTNKYNLNNLYTLYIEISYERLLTSEAISIWNEFSNTKSGETIFFDNFAINN